MMSSTFLLPCGPLAMKSSSFQETTQRETQDETSEGWAMVPKSDVVLSTTDSVSVKWRQGGGGTEAYLPDPPPSAPQRRAPVPLLPFQRVNLPSFTSPLVDEAQKRQKMRHFKAQNTLSPLFSLPPPPPQVARRWGVGEDPHRQQTESQLEIWDRGGCPSFHIVGYTSSPSPQPAPPPASARPTPDPEAASLVPVPCPGADLLGPLRGFWGPLRGFWV